MAFASSGTEPAQRCREIKIVLLGDSGVGKSSIAQRYVTDTFRPHGESTIGASFMSKMIVNNGSPCKCQIWDTAGQEKYHSLAPMYYRGAAAAILVYDMTKKSSFEKLQKWVDELKERGPDGIVLCVAANKCVPTSELDETPPTGEPRTSGFSGVAHNTCAQINQ